MTRAQVAEILQVSISTVRRMEGRQLHPEIGDNGVRLFEQTHIEAVAATFTRGAGGRRREPPRDRSPGELAALVFERFERRESLSQIVRGLAVTPKKVRTREWRTCLELDVHRRNPDMQTRDPDDYVTAHTVALDRVLATLSAGESVQLSVARRETHYNADDSEVTLFEELGGFVTSEPVTVDELYRRFGAGFIRLSAYSLAQKCLLWEVYGRLAPPTAKPRSRR